ncbi:DUF6624 domain-containing protein [Brevundimonas sp.]|uniref:DUF6624 domain-containing protein n=1 Tax=Brevundimonas sp. TaxID=1871086 RepID=UPI003A930091
MIHNFAAFALGVTQATAPDPMAHAALEVLRASIAEARDVQSALPPPQTDRDRLERMGAIDQAARQGLWKAMATVPPAERGRVRRALWPEVRAIDIENQQQLLTMVPEEGWFRRSRYGDSAAASAFLIVQHGDETLWERFLPVLADLVPSGEVAGPEYAMMYDRLQMTRDQPQRYGTQMTCPSGTGQWTLWRLEDAGRVDEYRSSVGLGPVAEYVNSFRTGAPPTC